MVLLGITSYYPFIPGFPLNYTKSPHSFLWILGNQYQEYRVEYKKQPITVSPKNHSGEESGLISTETRNENHELENIIDEDECMSFHEGQEFFRIHKAKERNPALIKAVKEKYLENTGDLRCQACGFSFKEFYGQLGEGFIEAHHLFPISDLTQEVETKISDIALVCSNCHRILHRRRPWLSSIDELKSFLNNK